MSKIAARHLERKACVYVRQSSMAQVEHLRESTQRQYGLRERAVSLGWRIEQVEIVDEDQGQSGASASGRGGFQRLVSEVALGALPRDVLGLVLKKGAVLVLSGVAISPGARLSGPALLELVRLMESWEKDS